MKFRVTMAEAIQKRVDIRRKGGEGGKSMRPPRRCHASVSHGKHAAVEGVWGCIAEVEEIGNGGKGSVACFTPERSDEG